MPEILKKLEMITCCFRIILDNSPFIQLCSDAAIVMLSGQLADGFTTIFVGELVRGKMNRIYITALL